MVYAYLHVHEHNTVDYTHDIVISPKLPTKYYLNQNRGSVKLKSIHKVTA